MVNIDKLNKEFKPKVVLTAEEMNEVVEKINEIIDKINKEDENISTVEIESISNKISENSIKN